MTLSLLCFLVLKQLYTRSLLNYLKYMNSPLSIRSGCRLSEDSGIQVVNIKFVSFSAIFHWLSAHVDIFCKTSRCTYILLAWIKKNQISDTYFWYKSKNHYQKIRTIRYYTLTKLVTKKKTKTVASVNQCLKRRFSTICFF